MIKHYEGRLGEFDYDNCEFRIEQRPFVHLHYKGRGLSVNLPKGCINTRYMFAGCKLPEGFTLGDFDTGEVVDMHCMFSGCSLPQGFSLGEGFDTSNVRDMAGMFEGCVFPNDFTLGDKFNTSNVINMMCMFFNCQLPGMRTTEEFGNDFGSIINWLKARTSNLGIKPNQVLTEELMKKPEKALEEQIANACEFIDDYFMNGEMPIGYRAINQMRDCGYSDDVIRQAMIKTIERIIQESSTSAQDMNLF